MQRVSMEATLLPKQAVLLEPTLARRNRANDPASVLRWGRLHLAYFRKLFDDCGNDATSFFHMDNLASPKDDRDENLVIMF